MAGGGQIGGFGSMGRSGQQTFPTQKPSSNQLYTQQNRPGPAGMPYNPNQSQSQQFFQPIYQAQYQDYAPQGFQGPFGGQRNPYGGFNPFMGFGGGFGEGYGKPILPPRYGNIDSFPPPTRFGGGFGEGYGMPMLPPRYGNIDSFPPPTRFGGGFGEGYGMPMLPPQRSTIDSFPAPKGFFDRQMNQSQPMQLNPQMVSMIGNLLQGQQTPQGSQQQSQSALGAGIAGLMG